VIVAAAGLGTVIAVLVNGFFVGALARLAVPGPDPMPIWLTIIIGLAGTIGGGGIAYAAGSRNAYVINAVGFLTAIALVIAYRRFVQKRPITGPGALKFPERGFGVARQRRLLEQLQRQAHQPPTPGTPDSTAQPGAEEYDTSAVENLQKLADLHDAGVLTDEEYEQKRRQIVDKLQRS
jgi:uncharacterized membrane protein YeaQ/YmgE (transglycosylase-associated protein family)